MPIHYKPTSGIVVPDDAPIQPPQAYVDNIEKVYNGYSTTLDLSGQNITTFAPNLLYNITTGSGWFNMVAVFTGGYIYSINLSANAMGAAQVNAIFARVKLGSSNFGLDQSGGTLVLNLSGGTNAAPTGQGLTDKQTLIDNGWTVTTN